MILPAGSVLDAPLKNIFHTSSSKVILASIISSGMSVCSSKVFGTIWLKICESLTFNCLLGNKSHVILRQQNSPIGHLEFKKSGFVMRIRGRLTLEMTCMFAAFIILLCQKSTQGVAHNSYIEQEWFSQNGGYQDRRLGEVLLDTLKNLLVSFPIRRKRLSSIIMWTIGNGPKDLL